MPKDPRSDRIEGLGWTVQKVLGKGQFGTAYMVTDDDNPKRKCVAKVCPVSLWYALDPSLTGVQSILLMFVWILTRFRRCFVCFLQVVSMDSLPEKDEIMAAQEVDLLKRMEHPFIVGYVTHHLHEDPVRELCIWMDYCNGGELRKTIKTRAKSNDHLAEATLMRWFAQMATAMAYVHRLHILHRDLKTSNVFHHNNDVRVGDFGISSVLEGTIDAAATVVGTPYYMSPEVCRSEQYSYKSDVWALGCVLYEMCMLKHTFESDCLLGLVYKIVSDEYDPIPEHYSEELKVVRWANAGQISADPLEYSRASDGALCEVLR